MSKLVQFKGTIYEKGYGLIAKTVVKDKNLSLGAKGVYSYLCAYAGSDGQTFPSANLIMHELGITKKTFYKYLNEVVTYGYINIEKIRDKKGKFDNNLYIIENVVPMGENLPHGKKSTVENLPCGKNVPTTNNNIYTNNNSSSSSSSKEQLSEVYKLYQELGFGLPNKIIAEMIEDDVKKYSKEWFMEALKIAVKENKLKLSYVEGILQNWKRNGGMNNGKAGDKNGSRSMSKSKHYNKQNKSTAGEERAEQYDLSDL
ncbi:helix-turn-helix domain-containing protein [Clostridium tetani]|uniref:helix-turn-helix domain-containing protein n=1 Tax=Clostridium tetani TaxID=1513 RepID=UPI0010273117|nr:helix-turn-helix domain-containing protein [Clostridium tetani]RXI70521.1 hypothetical protein DP127_09495 [Clostridium tetani]